MKRPKIRDMSPIERARFRLLQARRGAQSALKSLAAIQEPEKLTPEEHQNVAAKAKIFQSIIAVTKPSHVRAATVAQARSIIEYLMALTGGDTRRDLN